MRATDLEAITFYYDQHERSDGSLCGRNVTVMSDDSERITLGTDCRKCEAEKTAKAEAARAAATLGRRGRGAAKRRGDSAHYRALVARRWTTVESVAKAIRENVDRWQDREITFEQFDSEQRRLWDYAHSRSQRFSDLVAQAVAPFPK